MFFLACFQFENVKILIFPRVSKTHNKKVVKETPQTADARDYGKTR